MEGYSNYQQVIDAIKAEYVNARDLKRKATGKNRTAKNADSFKKRKESESESLDSKLNSVKESLKNSLSDAISDLDQSKFGELKTKLSELQAKLKYIDSESNRFDQLYDLDPKKYPAKSNTEKQTFSVVRSLLAAAIKDAEAAIDTVYNGESYSSIVESTIPNRYDNTEQEIWSYYNNLEKTYSKLFDKAQGAISTYTNELFPSIDAMKQKRSELIGLSQDLSELKSELAKLLEDESSQDEIDTKENEIDKIKQIMLESVSQLKTIDIFCREWTKNKFNNVSVFIDDLLDFQDEFIGFYDNNNNLLDSRPRPQTFINVNASRLYDALFIALGESSEFDLVWNGLSQAKQEYLDNECEISNVNNKLKSLSELSSTFATGFDGDNNDENGQVQSFQQGISNVQKDFFVRHSMDIHKATANYMSQKATFDFNMSKIEELMDLSKEERDNHIQYAENLSRVKMEQLYADFELSKLQNGHYEGTEEQQQAFNEARDLYFYFNHEYFQKRAQLEIFSNNNNIFKGIFPDFYKSLDELTALYTEAEDVFNAVYEKHSNMVSATDAAYEYLQTLTAGEAEYVSALADFEAKLAERDAYYVDVVQPAQTASDDAYNYLQTLIEGEAGYQSLVVSLQETIATNREKLAVAGDARSTAEDNKAIAESTIERAVPSLSMAQSDKAQYLANGGTDQVIIDGYDSTIAYQQVTIAQANATIAQADATIAQANSDIFEAKAIIEDANEVLKNATESHYIYLGAQTDYDAKSVDLAEKENQYKSLSDTSEESYIFLQTLTDEDEAYHTALADWNKKDTEANEFKAEVNKAKENLEAADNSLRNLYRQEYGQEFNLRNGYGNPINGGYLSEALSYVGHFEKIVTEVVKELKDAERAFKVSKSEMTFVESTPYEKREALLRQTDAEKSESQVESWFGILTSHTSYLARLEYRIIELVRALRENPFFVKAGTPQKEELHAALATKTMYDAKDSVSLEVTKKMAISHLKPKPEAPVTDGPDKLLQEIKEFMDGKNLYAIELLKSLEQSFAEQAVQDKMDFYRDCINELELGGDDLTGFAILSDMKGDILKNITAHQGEVDYSFQDTLLQIAGWNRNHQQFNDVLIAYQIEDEVNNGNPIVPGQNGGGKGDFPS